MSWEHDEQPVPPERQALIRAACDGLVPDGLRAELDRDPKLRAEYEAARAVTSTLREALRPEPLPDAFHRRLVSRLDRPLVPVHSRRRLSRVPVLSAAAAVLACVVLGPWTLPEYCDTSAGTVALSYDEAKEIVAALGVLAWESPLDYAVERVQDDLESLQLELQADQETRSTLPWGPEDDWDRPPDDQNTRASAPALCVRSDRSAGWLRRTGGSVRTHIGV